VELGEEWNGGEAELGWRRCSGEIRGQRASRPWLGARGLDRRRREVDEELGRGRGGVFIGGGGARRSSLETARSGHVAGARTASWLAACGRRDGREQGGVNARRQLAEEEDALLSHCVRTGGTVRVCVAAGEGDSGEGQAPGRPGGRRGGCRRTETSCCGARQADATDPARARCRARAVACQSRAHHGHWHLEASQAWHFLSGTSTLDPLVSLRLWFD
jgi:hypothetical protein